ncbi:Heat shock 70 kDa protein 12A [Acropora cervicornis]|uniref:Heat shock 70 kDa protein 12A n=1 Tax=Acropora cervicornis TaxID=6130 RepID=A0AAD9UXT9_ACRCE|nr:Heat shock 70 kDa protein 12A [Acropora cervicornis]
MREAAYQAGLITPNNSEQLIIALEPEAAAVFCRQSKLREFVEGRNRDETVSSAFVPAQTQYLVVDNGGGTMDVTVHEVDDNDDVKEIYHATGGDFGGTKVDKEFQNLLEKVFGKDLMDEFCRSHPSDWLELMNDFEMKKRGDRVMRGEETRVRLPANFVNLMRHENIGRSDNEIIKRHYHAEQLRISKEYLCLGSEIVKSLFESTINAIIKHLETLGKKKELRGVKLMFLVGGFSESPLLQAAIKKKFKHKYKILIPNDAETAVVKGAVMFGRRPHVVVERCLSETYGTDCCVDFINGLHKYEKLKIIDGKRKCQDIFSVLARENEKVKMGQCKTSTFCPILANQTTVGFDFYTSSNPDVFYTTDAGVRELPGCMSVESPNTSKGTKREIKLEVYFNTEIKMIGIDVETGNEATTSIDFLWH